jgi:glycosyltransferase involved in cell wall biosynthesis
MAGSPLAAKLVRRIGAESRIHLLPVLDVPQMADLFRAARVSVSLSTHDGTPNSLLESMASACFPVVGDVESVREWVRDGHNGLIVSADDPAAVSAALFRALTDDALLQVARDRNRALVHERASRASIMRLVGEHYEAVVHDHRRRSHQCA